MNQGIHFVDMIRYLGGEVTEVVSMIGTQARNMECEDTGSALLRFENGALGNIFVTMAGLSDLEGSVTLIGETGQVKIGGAAMNRIEHWQFADSLPDQDRNAERSKIEITSVYGSGHVMAYMRVVNHLNENVSYPVSAKDVRNTLEALCKVNYKSCRNAEACVGVS